jgi:cytochrome b
MNRPDSTLRRVRVWDLPTRVFHWALVALVVFSFVTAKIGGNALTYHMWSGYTILTLILFRLVWGFVGGRESRFASFVRGPTTVFQYAAGLLGKGSERYLGHNPLGGWSVVAMLTALALQASTGLFANDEIATEGPLAQYVSLATSLFLTRIHRLNQWVLVALVSLHVLAVLFYLFAKRDNLIGPMIHGHKTWSRNGTLSVPNRTAAAFAIVCVAAVSVWLLVR